MANPQKEHGFTAIANEIMEALARTRIPGEARQVLDVIIRHTYGWGKKTDHISLSQFCNSTGLKKPNVTRAIKKLVEMNLITVIKSDNQGKKFDRTAIGQYGLVKDWQQWKPLSKKITGGHVIKSDNDAIIKNDNKPLSKMITTKEVPKPAANQRPAVQFYLFQKHGFSIEDGRQWAAQYGEQYVWLKVAHLEFRIAYHAGQVKRPKQFLRASIKEDYDEPDGFYFSTELEACNYARMGQVDIHADDQQGTLGMVKSERVAGGQRSQAGEEAPGQEIGPQIRALSQDHQGLVVKDLEKILKQENSVVLNVYEKHKKEGTPLDQMGPIVGVYIHQVMKSRGLI